MKDEEKPEVLKDAVIDVPGIKVGHNQNIKAGTGATVGKILGGLRSMKSGLGTASFKSQELIIGAILQLR